VSFVGEEESYLPLFGPLVKLCGLGINHFQIYVDVFVKLLPKSTQAIDVAVVRSHFLASHSEESRAEDGH
jgi:hypothetical protein